MSKRSLQYIVALVIGFTLVFVMKGLYSNAWDVGNLVAYVLATLVIAGILWLKDSVDRERNDDRTNL